MTASSEQEILTCWLIPAEPARSYFVALIGDLSERFDAPVFEPHVTTYVTQAEDEDPTELLDRALADCPAHRLLISGIDYSAEFTKTVFVQFQATDEITRLGANFRRASVAGNEYRVNPHLSLIYKTMPREAKQEITASIKLPFTEVLFDSIKAVISPAKIKSRENVEAWRVVATRSLTG